MPNEMKAIIDNCTITSYDASNAFLKKFDKSLFSLIFQNVSPYWPLPRFMISDSHGDGVKRVSILILIYCFLIKFVCLRDSLFHYNWLKIVWLWNLLTSKAFKLTMIEIQSLILNQPQQHNFSIRTIVMIESLKMNWDLWSKNLNV